MAEPPINSCSYFLSDMRMWVRHVPRWSDIYLNRAIPDALMRAEVLAGGVVLVVFAVLLFWNAEISRTGHAMEALLEGGLTEETKLGEGTDSASSGSPEEPTKEAEPASPAAFPEGGMLGAPAEEVASVTPTDEMYFYFGGQRVASVDLSGGNAVYFYHNDHLGSARAITNAAGTVVWSSDFAPFGQSLRETVPASGRTNAFKFTGKELDLDDLYYSGARFYAPSLGRFTQADPILRQTVSNYAYGNNNPLTMVDPTGMIAHEVEASVGYSMAVNQNPNVPAQDRVQHGASGGLGIEFGTGERVDTSRVTGGVNVDVAGANGGADITATARGSVGVGKGFVLGVSGSRSKDVGGTIPTGLGGNQPDVASSTGIEASVQKSVQKFRVTAEAGYKEGTVGSATDTETYTFTDPDSGVPYSDVNGLGTQSEYSSLSAGLGVRRGDFSVFGTIADVNSQTTAGVPSMPVNSNPFVTSDHHATLYSGQVAYNPDQGGVTVYGGLSGGSDRKTAFQAGIKIKY